MRQSVAQIVRVFRQPSSIPSNSRYQRLYFFCYKTVILLSVVNALKKSTLVFRILYLTQMQPFNYLSIGSVLKIWTLINIQLFHSKSFPQYSCFGFVLMNNINKIRQDLSHPLPNNDKVPQLKDLILLKLTKIFSFFVTVSV